jgi:FG-GAP-like repeat
MHLQSPRAIVSRHLANQPLPRYAAVAILSLFLLCSAESRASDTNQFYRLPVYASGGTPVKLVTADFNHDGKPDVVALNDNNVLSILLGSGNSAFAASKTIATLPANTASIAARMVAGDFNGDGNQDVVVLPSGGNFVRVFLGHGDGTFAAPGQHLSRLDGGRHGSW